MTGLIIYTNGHIELDGNDTGLGVMQSPSSTRVYVRSDGRRMSKRADIALPRKRYSLAADKPLSGNPGRDDFERDLRAAVKLTDSQKSKPA
jgi:hypothetical protein